MSHSPSPAAAAAAEAGAERADDRQQLQKTPPPPPPREDKEVFFDAPEEQEPPPPREEEEEQFDEEEQELEPAMGNLKLGEEEEDEFDEARTPVGLGAGGIISPAATAAGASSSGSHHHHAFHGDPALANTLIEVCDVCEREECACDKVAVKRGVFFEGTPAETKRGGKPALPHKPNRAIEPTSWRPANKTDFRSHHRPPHRDPHHASVASRDADFVGDVPHGEGGTRSGKKLTATEEEEAASSPTTKPPPVSAIDAEVQPPVVPMPGKKGRPSHVGGDRIPALEVAHDPFERAGAPSSASGAGGRGHVAGHKHRGQRHQEFKTLG